MRTALKLLRIKNGLTQDEMAAKVGYSRNQYQRVENGEYDPTLRFLVGLSEAFGLTLDEAKEVTKLENQTTKNDR